MFSQRRTLYVLIPTLICLYNLHAIRHRWRLQRLIRGFAYFTLMITMSVECALLTCLVLQRLTSVYRPDFLSRCFPSATQHQLIEQTASLALRLPHQCTQRDLSILENGRLSFPSSETALATSVLFSTIFWFIHMIKELRGYTAEVLIIPLVAHIPLIYYFITSMMSSPHNAHWAQDILAGFAIGAICTMGSFAFYFPGPLTYGARLQPGRSRSMEVDEPPMYDVDPRSASASSEHSVLISEDAHIAAG